MIALDQALLFILSASILALSPGPDNIFVIMQSAMHGRVRGLAVVLGLCTGLIWHTSIVALGLGAVMAAEPRALMGIKFIGAAYLCYLAYQAFRAGKVQQTSPPPQPIRKLVLRGAIMNATNPKVTLFFLAFLPQFIQESEKPIGWQIVVLGGLFALVTLVVFGTMALLAGSLRVVLLNARAQSILHKVAAIVFIGLALWLVIA